MLTEVKQLMTDIKEQNEVRLVGFAAEVEMLKAEHAKDRDGSRSWNPVRSRRGASPWRARRVTSGTRPTTPKAARSTSCRMT